MGSARPVTEAKILVLGDRLPSCVRRLGTVPPGHATYAGQVAADPSVVAPPTSRGPWGRLGEGVAAFFCVDDPWQRGGAIRRRDLAVGLVALALSLASLELSRSAGLLRDLTTPVWLQWLAVVLAAALLVARRRWPLTVACLGALHMFVVGVTMPEVMGQFAMQILYFAILLSGVGWARSRRDMQLVMGGIVLFMAAWLSWQLALGSGIDMMRRDIGGDADERFGPLSPITAGVLLTGLVNLVYFGGAILAGQVAWRGARQRARLAEQADRLRNQADSLRRRAVLEERLRIARELHDVVAHHVSVIGIQAAAGRRVLGSDPASAAGALGQIERSSREAVTQMRGLLGTLREGDDADDAGPASHRAPEPGLDDLPALVAGHREPGFWASYDLVESHPGAAGRVPGPLGLSLFRTTQEALANVRRHSTAGRATVVTRVELTESGGHAEVEVVDDGRPRTGTSGSGLGQLGIRERAASQRGEVEIGPRPLGGYRVRVRLPLAPTGGPQT